MFPRYEPHPAKTLGWGTLRVFVICRECDFFDLTAIALGHGHTGIEVVGSVLPGYEPDPPPRAGPAKALGWGTWLDSVHAW